MTSPGATESLPWVFDLSYTGENPITLELVQIGAPFVPTQATASLINERRPVFLSGLSRKTTTLTGNPLSNKSASKRDHVNSHMIKFGIGTHILLSLRIIIADDQTLAPNSVSDF
jgi:hypothetical protein